MLPKKVILTAWEIWTPHRKWGSWAVLPRTVIRATGSWVKYRVEGQPRIYVSTRKRFELWIRKTYATRHNPFFEEI